MTKRDTLARYGRRGDQVRVVLDRGEDRYVVLYRESDGSKHRRKFPRDARGKKEALTWAETFHQTREERRVAASRPAPITVRELWTQFTDSPAWGDLRDASQRNYGPRWRRWERFIDAQAIANDTTLLDIDRFITRAREEIAINQVRQTLNVARIVYNWGQRRKLITSNEFALHRWKRPKDAIVHEPEEYTADEFRRLLLSISPQDNRRWRLHVCLMLAGSQGQRANAVRHLRWEDMNLSAAVITWPAEFQKNGLAFEQPMTWEAVSALATARYWLEMPTGRAFTRMNRSQRLTADALSRSPWVLPSHGDPLQPYGYQAMWIALRAAELDAKVEHRERRAFHGLRKMVAGNVWENSGDERLAMEWINDVSPKMQRAYLKKRKARLERAAESTGGGNSNKRSRV